MKIVVFSDIHGNFYSFKAFLEDINNLEYDKIVFVGDIFGYYYDQNKIIERLLHLDKLIWINGNHDKYFIDSYINHNNKALIEKYGSSYDLNNGNYTKENYILISGKEYHYILEYDIRIGIFHGTPDNITEGRLYPDGVIENTEEYEKYDLVILGHTHCRMIKKCGKTVVVNPGSLGQPRDGSGFGYAIIDTEKRNVLFKEVCIDKNELYNRIKENDPNLNKLIDVLERKKTSLYEKDISYSY